MRGKSLEISVYIALLFMCGCGVKPSNPGLCSLNCSGAVIGGADASYVISLATPAPAIQCPTGLTQLTAFSGPISTQFVIWDKYKDSNGHDVQIPVPNISFNPLVNGGLVPTQSNSENVTKYPAGQTLPDGTTHNIDMYYPYQYVGIVTPKSNWCSDSCGVMTVEIWPYCPVAGSTNNVNVQVSTGAKFSETSQISITTPTVTN